MTFVTLKASGSRRKGANGGQQCIVNLLFERRSIDLTPNTIIASETDDVNRIKDKIQSCTLSLQLYDTATPKKRLYMEQR